MKKLNKIEKYIIAISDPEEYNVFVCPGHGAYAIRKGSESTVCLYCKQQGEMLEQQQELYEQYRKELAV